MSKRTAKRCQGFSLLELVIVVVIIGIIAAIAIPRMSRGSGGAAAAALNGDLAVMRNAIDLYSAEHNGAFPTATDVADQLVQYTDAAGDSQATKDSTHIYGPYVRKIPILKVGAKKGSTGIAASNAAGIGWIYDASTGDIQSNTTAAEKDDAGVAYNTY